MPSQLPCRRPAAYFLITLFTAFRLSQPKLAGMSTQEQESRPVPLEPDPRLTRAGQRSGEGLASIMPYLVRSLKGKTQPTTPAPDEKKGTLRR